MSKQILNYKKYRELDRRIKTFFLLAIFLALPQFAVADENLLPQSALEYLGAVRTDDTFSYASGPIAISPNGLFMATNDNKIAEITIPTLKAFVGSYAI